MSDGVDSLSVETKINKLLYSNRASKAENNGGEVTSLPVTLGDKVYIYYIVRVENEGRSEIISSAASMLGAVDYCVGSYRFLPIENIDRSVEWNTVYASGLDAALIGAVPAEHKLAQGETVTSGKVLDGDEIVFSYTEGGKRRIFKTSLSKCDAVYGEGMSSFLSKAEIGISAQELSTSLSGETLLYNNIMIEYAIRSVSTPLTAEIYFPHHYAISELRGRTATVEIRFRGSVVYNVPEYNSEFITGTLGIGEDKLSAYTGADTVARHRAMLLSECESEAKYIRDCLVEEAVWDHLVSKAQLTELPREALEKSYNDIYSGIYLMYVNLYSSIFDSPEKFSAWYYGLDGTSDVASHVMKLCEREVTEKLIFYHIAKAEGLLPTGEDFESAYNTLVDEEFSYYTEGSLKAELDALSGEAREKRLAELRVEMLSTYGEEYFAEIVYYEAAFPMILGYANITYGK